VIYEFAMDTIDLVCHLLDRRRLGQDDPTDLPYGGEPRPGGTMTPFKPDGTGNTTTELTRPAKDTRSVATDARSAAMYAAMRVSTDSPVPRRRPAREHALDVLVRTRDAVGGAGLAIAAGRSFHSTYILFYYVRRMKSRQLGLRIGEGLHVISITTVSREGGEMSGSRRIGA
jgi:hypothetical protein